MFENLSPAFQKQARLPFSSPVFEYVFPQQDSRPLAAAIATAKNQVALAVAPKNQGSAAIEFICKAIGDVSRACLISEGHNPDDKFFKATAAGFDAWGRARARALTALGLDTNEHHALMRDNHKIKARQLFMAAEASTDVPALWFKLESIRTALEGAGIVLPFSRHGRSVLTCAESHLNVLGDEGYIDSRRIARLVERAFLTGPGMTPA